MRILIDIVHPAHVHFFRNAIELWRAAGDKILITARDKDLAFPLLDLYGLPYERMGKAGTGKPAVALELVTRCFKLWRLTTRFKPDVMVGIAGPGMAHVGWARGIPALVFTDTENATLSNRITFPFATRIFTPSCYEAEVPAAKNVRYDGYHELAYTHPQRFTPDPAVIATWGLDPGDDFIVVRFVSWEALHDTRDHGVTDAVSLVERLRPYGKVLISSEAPLPAELEPHRIVAAPHCIHHLLAFARLFIGESATMASESATLGTPAIFVSTSTRGYTNEEGAKYGLVHTFSDPVHGQEQAVAKALEILADPAAREQAERRRRKLLADKIDVTAYLLEIVAAYGSDKRGKRRGP